METADALIAAMAADVDDNTPRLVYADWLEEHGQPERAEFIRLQCRIGGDAADRSRATTLMAEHGKAWDAPLAPLAAKTWYSRGFPYLLKVELQRLVENQSLLTLVPEWRLALQRHTHAPLAELCERLVNGPFAERISGLNLTWTGWHVEEVETLLSPPLAGRLRELRFGDEDRGNDYLALVLASPDLRLKEFGFHGDSEGGIGDEGCRSLAAASTFAGLTELALPNNALGPEGAIALASSPHLTRLENLDLAGGSNTPNRIGTPGALAFAASTNFRQLTSLNLLFNHIGDAGFAALVRSPNLPKLASLNVPGNNITDAGVRGKRASTCSQDAGKRRQDRRRTPDLRFPPLRLARSHRCGTQDLTVASRKATGTLRSR